MHNERCIIQSLAPFFIVNISGIGVSCPASCPAMKTLLGHEKARGKEAKRLATFDHQL